MGKDKFAISVNNRFMLQSDSDSDSEIGNHDPYEVMTQAVATATKKAKQQAKEEAQQAKVVVKKPEAEEAKPVKKEPRGNQQRRYGKRNEGERRDFKKSDGAVEDGDKKERNADRKREDRRGPRRPRNQERKSGNPRTGVKATEKRGGAGTGNWGKEGEIIDDAEVKEDTTPEAGENTENAENGEGEAVAEEPKEVYLTLDEYYAGLGGDNAEKPADKTDKAGDANANTKAANPLNNLLGFQSDYSGRRGGDRRGDRRGGDDRRNNRRGGNDRKQRDFTFKEDAFPALGK